MAGIAVMDFKDYQSKLSRERLDVLEVVEKGTLANTQRLLRDFWTLIKDDQLFNHILLLTALRRQHKSLTKFLTKENCPVTIPQKTGHYCSPLYYAVEMNDVEIFKALQERGASIFYKDTNHDSAFELAMAKYDGSIINFVLKDLGLPRNLENLEPDRENDIAYFHAVCWTGEWKAIEMLLSRNFSLDSRSSFNRDDWKGFTPLHFALHRTSYRSDEAVSKLLLHDNVDLFAKDRRGRTPIHLAFRNHFGHMLRNETVIERISSSNGNHTINPVDDSGLSHFHILCTMQFRDEEAMKHLNCVKYFIDNQIDLNSSVSLKDEQFPGYTALHIVVDRSCWHILETLLENGADPNRVNKNGLTPLHMVYSDKGITGKVDHKQRLKIVELFLRYGADPVAKDPQDRTPLHIAFSAHNGRRPLDDSEKLLLSQNLQGINHTDKHGISYLHMACTGDDLGIVKTLVANGASISSRVPKGSPRYGDFTALHFAAQVKQVEMVEFLLSHGADVNSVSRLESTPLYLACSNDFEQVLQSDDQNRANAEDIVWVPSRKNHIRTIQLLIDYGASVNYTSSQCSTPLMHSLSLPRMLYSQFYACYRQPSGIFDEEVFARQKEVMDILLRHGADINACDSYSGSILHILINDYCGEYAFKKELMKIAMEKGADVNALSKGSEQFTPLHVTVEKSIKNRHDSSLIDFFLENGANINARSSNLDTPLHIAARSYDFSYIHEDVLAKLLDHPDIDVNARNNLGQTPLHLAMDRKNYFTIERLLESGADIHLTNNDGYSPIHAFIKRREEGSPETFSIGPKEIRKLRTAIVAHVNKLMKLKLHVSETVYRDSVTLSHFLPKKDLVTMNSEMDEELQYLKSQKLDNYTSYYDILFKDGDAMTRHVLNDDLRDAITSKVVKNQFPHFGGFINRQFNKGCKRLSILEPAKSALNFISNINWPDSCSDKILSDLSDENLKILTESVSIKKGVKRPAKVTLSLEESSAKVPRSHE